MSDGAGGIITTIGQFPDTPRGQHQRWATELQASENDQKEWREQAERANKKYLDEKSTAEASAAHLNLFHANINIQLAILFGNIPRADVSRRYADPNDEEARVSAEMIERLLNSDIEDPTDDFSEELKDSLQDWKISGLGQIRLRYEADFETKPGKPPMMRGGREVARAVPDVETRTAERIETAYVYRDDFRWSPARRWKDVRWVAFKAEMSRDQARKRFRKTIKGGKNKGQTIGDLIPLESRTVGKKGGADSSEGPNDAWSRAIVWEIWSKEDRKVYWFCRGFDMILDVEDDPLELKGFFPCPRPLVSNRTTKRLLPKPDYEIDKNLYQEIDNLTDRIKRLEDAAKVTGAFNKDFPELGRILEEAGEGQLIGVQNWNQLGEKGGLAGCMDWVPLDPIVKAIEVLSAKRIEKMQMLDQIIGLSAAIRGQSDPHSTATANRIEAGFASTRLETEKDEVARFVSDIERIRAEIVSKQFDAQTILERSNSLRMETIDVPGPVNPATGQPGPPTKQPNMPLLQKAVELIQSSIYDYRIEVKADSIAIRDYAALKQERVETVQALAGLFQQAMPMVQMLPQAAPFILELSKWVIAATKGSQQMEGVFDRFAAQVETQISAPKPPAPPDPRLEAAKIKAQAEVGKAQAGIAQTKMDAQAHVMKTGMDLQASQAQHQMEMVKMAAQTQANVMRGAAAPLPLPPGGP
jgi:hypothetical protein